MHPPLARWRPVRGCAPRHRVRRRQFWQFWYTYALCVYSIYPCTHLCWYISMHAYLYRTHMCTYTHLLGLMAMNVTIVACAFHDIHSFHCCVFITRALMTCSLCSSRCSSSRRTADKTTRNSLMPGVAAQVCSAPAVE